MVILLKFSYPIDKRTKVAEIFNNAQTLPDFITRKGPYGGIALGIGVKGYTLFEFDKNRLTEAMEAFSKRMMAYMEEPSYTWEYITYYDAAELTAMMES